MLSSTFRPKPLLSRLIPPLFWHPKREPKKSVSLLQKCGKDNNMTTTAFNTELLDRLNPVHAAFHDHIGVSACLEGTREQLLDDIEQWMMNLASKKVFWLKGAAGTGKTTIARSVAEKASKRNFLGATFFFSRASPDRRDFKSVIPTIAYQLADRDPRLRSRIAAALEDDNTLRTADVAIQAKELLLEALRAPFLDPPLCWLLVVDALDECDRADNGAHGGDLIPELLAAVKDAPFVKVFLTSRSDPTIESMFIDEDLGDATRNLALHRDIEEKTVQSDIRYYLRFELSKLGKRVGKNVSFPEESSIDVLAERAGTLFVYASTVVKYISSLIGRPDRRLATLLQAKPEHSRKQFGPLDSLYSQILRTAHESLGGRSDVDESLRSVLVALVLVRQELAMNELVALTGVDEDTLIEVLGLMSAVLNYQHGSAEPVRLMHLSFSEFLSDRERCSELPGYAVDPSCDHLWLTERCLGSLDAKLSVGAMSDKDIDAQRAIQAAQFWLYSCGFWAEHWLEHLQKSDRPEVIPQGLNEFCTLYLPQWIQFVSWMNCRNPHDVLASAVQAFSILHVRVTILYYFGSEAQQCFRIK
jgi:hypothetical protein